MRRVRRFCALAIIVALGVSLPARTPHGCVVCPPDCPMHARRAAGVAEPERKMGCHRAPAPPRGKVCVRSACGRDADAGTAAVLLGVLGATRVTGASAPPVLLRPTTIPIASVFAPEPPTEPPRFLLG